MLKPLHFFVLENYSLFICLIILCIYLLSYLSCLVFWLEKNEVFFFFMGKQYNDFPWLHMYSSRGPLAKGLKGSKFHLFSIPQWLTKAVFGHCYPSLFWEQRLEVEHKDTCLLLFSCLGLQLKPKELEYPVVLSLKLHILGLFTVWAF